MNCKPRVLIITANFRQAGCTVQLLQSVSALAGFGDCRIFVVDNNSCDDSAERIRQSIAKLRNVELLVSSENRGYFGAAKWALNQYMAQHTLPDWVIVCNNDVVFDHANFLSRLRERDPLTAGVLAPAVISSLTGHDSNPMIAARPGRIRLLRYRFLLSSYSVARLTQWLAPVLRRVRHCFRGKRFDPSGQRNIYAPHGAMIIFSRRYFEAGAAIDDGSFLFAEEFSVAETCRRLGLPLVYDPELAVRHNENQTTGRRLTRKMYEYQKSGLQYAIRTYLQPSRFSRSTGAATAVDLS